MGAAGRRGYGGGGRGGRGEEDSGVEVLSDPWRTVLGEEDGPCGRRQRHFEGWLNGEDARY